MGARVDVWRRMAILTSLVLARPACALEPADLLLFDIAFASIEAESHTAFLSTGGKRSLSLPGTTARAFIMTSTGLSLSDTRRHARGKLLATEIDRQARLIFGIERGEGPVFTAIGIGPSMAQMRKRYGGGHLAPGVALQADIWVRPDKTFYAALSSAADSASQNWWNRLRIGYRPDGMRFAFGPELVGSVSRSSGKVKLGFHATEISLWKFNFDLSGGMMWDHDGRRNRYITLSGYIRY